MTITEDGPIVPPALIARVRQLLMTPKAEWAVIDAERATIGGIYRGYLFYICAVGPVCRMIGNVAFQHANVFRAALSSVVTYALWLAMIYIMALVIDVLAPHFGGAKDRVQAFKVAAYASTASALSGAFALIPAVSFLAIVGFYSFYLLWIGLPKLMRVPPEKALGYFAVLLVMVMGIGLMLGFALGPVFMRGA